MSYPSISYITLIMINKIIKVYYCTFCLVQQYRDRLMAQEIYLDFLDEPEGSVRRRREGTYSSYVFGHGNRTVKVDETPKDRNLYLA